MRGLLARERSARHDLAGREAELARLNERLAEDSRRDPLTGLLNRRALATDLPARSEAGPAVAVALCDVDRFKSYNDRLGHLAGDQALRALAATVQGALRGDDAAYRFGGEELLLVLAHARRRDRAVRRRAHPRAVADAALPHPDGLGGVLTVSIGVAFGTGDPAALLAEADSALYEAKAGGRNRVVGPSRSMAPRQPARRRSELIDEPVLRHLRGVLAIGRAAATGRGAQAVAEALAQTIRSELRFETVAVNFRDRSRDESETVLVLGDEAARAAIEGTGAPWKDWAPLVQPRHERCGALWLPAGAHDFTDDPTVWISPAPVAPALDAWQPEDMLLLPLRASTGELFGLVSVDNPRSGRRPDDAEITVLMAVADHAAVALEHIHREHALADASHELPEHRLAAVMLLAETLDLRDAGTSRHSLTVGGFARDIAKALGLPSERVERIRAAGVLHDLGKLGIADAILHKPGPLDEDEWREMKRHPEIGARILDHSGLADIAVLGQGAPRAHRRPRLPARPGGRGDPARGPDPRRRRRLRGDDGGPPVPGRHAGRRGRRGAPALGRVAVRRADRRRLPRARRRPAPADVAGYSLAGIIARTTVPPPGAPWTVSSPPSAPTRSARPWSPEPSVDSAPPMPSSRTSTSRYPRSSSTVTEACSACACFAMLASDSEMT